MQKVQQSSQEHGRYFCPKRGQWCRGWNTAALEVANGPEDEDTTVQEVANDLCLVVEDTIVLPTFVKKRKRDTLHISILLEASFIKDIDGLFTQKGKCQCTRG